MAQATTVREEAIAALRSHGMRGGLIDLMTEEEIKELALCKTEEGAHRGNLAALIARLKKRLADNKVTVDELELDDR